MKDLKNIYSIAFYNNPNGDGTLLSSEMGNDYYGTKIPRGLIDFVYSQITPNIYIAMLNSNNSRLYILNDEADKYTTYNYNSETDIRVALNLDRFDPDTMRLVSPMKLPPLLSNAEKPITIINMVADSDMGHLLIDAAKGENIPTRKINDFAHTHIKKNISYAIDIEERGYRYYILKDGVDKHITFNYDPKTVINVEYKLDKFDPTRMKYR